MSAHQLKWENIPAEMKALRQWAVCGPEYDKAVPKRPYNPLTKRPASPTDPSTWVTFEEAVASGASGIGFMLSADDPLYVVDLDTYKSAAPENHRLILEAAGTYAERSQSGEGTHIIGRGIVGEGRNSRAHAIEIYDRDRFIIMTGDRSNDHDIADDQDLADFIIQRLGGGSADLPHPYESRISDEADADLVRRISGYENGAKLDALMNGNVRLGNGKDGDGALSPQQDALAYPSQSEADMSLLSMLCFHSTDDAQVARIFAASVLGQREKAQRKDYVWRCIKRARLFDCQQEHADRTSAERIRAGLQIGKANTSREDDQPPIALPDTLPPVDPFDISFLPDTFQPWASDVAERMQCPIDFIAVAIIVAASAAIGRRIGIRPKPEDDWLVVPNLWGLAIARPGMMKSPAIGEAMRPLKRLEAKERDRQRDRKKDYDREMRSYKLLKSAAEKKLKKDLDNDESADINKGHPVEPKEPKATRYIVTDSTYEALGDILAYNPFGVLVHRDEIMGLLKTLDREENAAAKAFFLSAWAGDEGYTFDRIMRGYQHIDAVCIALLGTTQPAKIADYVSRAISGGGSDDGMIQRFSLMVWPDIPKDWRHVRRGADREAFKRVDMVFDRLVAPLSPSGGLRFGGKSAIPYVTFDAEAAELYIEWLGRLEARLRSGDLQPALESHLAKYRSLVPSLALIAHQVDGHTGDVGVEVLQRAIAFVAYLESHAKRVYGAGMRGDVEGAKSIIDRIEKGDLVDGFTMRDVHKKDWRHLTQWTTVRDALDMLVEYRWLREETTRGQGRPTMRYFRRF